MTPAEALDHKERLVRDCERIAQVPRSEWTLDHDAHEMASIAGRDLPLALPITWSAACASAVVAASGSYPADAWPTLAAGVLLPPRQLHWFPPRRVGPWELVGIFTVIQTVHGRQVVNLWLVGYSADPARWHGVARPLFIAAWALVVGDPIRAAVPSLYGTEIRWLLAAWTFLQQRILVTSRAALDRATIRRAERANLDPLVHVVTFRKAEPHAPEGTRDVEWHCQWLVRGHFRKQPYPSEHTTRAIWIAPYIKGPADQPMRTPAPEVWAVNR